MGVVTNKNRFPTYPLTLQANSVSMQNIKSTLGKSSRNKEKYATEQSSLFSYQLSKAIETNMSIDLRRNKKYNSSL